MDGAAIRAERSCGHHRHDEIAEPDVGHLGALTQRRDLFARQPEGSQRAAGGLRQIASRFSAGCKNIIKFGAHDGADRRSAGSRMMIVDARFQGDREPNGDVLKILGGHGVRNRE